MGVFSSVNAAVISMSFESLPVICSLNPEFNERSRLFPIVNPLKILPDFYKSEPAKISSIKSVLILATLTVSSFKVSSLLNTSTFEYVSGISNG